LKNVSFKRAFEIADDVLRQGVQGVSDVITNPELINLDFADVRTVLRNKGLAHMGIGYGKGEKRVIEAVRGAVFSPLLETDIEGATGIIVNISGGEDMLLSEVTEACDIVRQVVDPTANIIFGTAFVPDKKDIEITIIATGFMDKNAAPARSVGSTPIVSGTPVAAALYTAEEVASTVEEEASEEEIREEIVIQRPVFTRPEPAPAPAPAPAPVVEPQREDEIQSSRIDYTRSGKQVPAFLRRIRGDRQ
ncbi:MAG: hypothetical protein IKW16_04785, partial [Clostridia bacterium]|nr:hypothetical protein [Clostridia bacterium]